MSEETSATKPSPRKRASRRPPAKPSCDPDSTATSVEIVTTPEAPEVQPIPEHPISEIQAVHHKKIKLVRDSFKFPPEEYAVFAELKRRCAEAGREVKKSELVRAGLMTLKALSDKELIEMLNGMHRLKTGRPAK
jgi:hypothetical protein